MRSKIYRVFFFILGLATLIYMVNVLGIAEIMSSLQKTGWWFVPVLLSWAIIYWMNALAFRDIIAEPNNDRMKIPFWKIFQLTVSGYAINYITPFVALGGEPYRMMELKRYVGDVKAGSAVLLYGMMHILSHLVFWVLSVGLIIAFVPSSPIVLGACITILLLALLLGWWFSRVYRKGIVMSTVAFLSRIPVIKTSVRRFAETKGGHMADIDKQVVDLYRNRKPRFYSSLAWEFLARVIGCAEIYFIARAVDVDMTYAEALIVSSGSSLFANLVFFFPMQLGTREGGMAMAMASVGYAASTGVFIGIATRIREFVWIGIGLLLMVLTKKQLKDFPQE